MILTPPCAVLRFCVHKSSACQEKKTDFQGTQTKGSSPPDSTLMRCNARQYTYEV